MNRIAKTLATLKVQNRKALIPYVTAGFPFADITPDLMHGMVAAGADVIELGVPFSDPSADGPVIQKAGDKALSDFITEWASTDEGKHFVAAADTQGGGSHGGRGAHHQPIKGNAGGTREEAIARAEQLLKQHASEE